MKNREEILVSLVKKRWRDVSIQAVPKSLSTSHITVLWVVRLLSTRESIDFSKLQKEDMSCKIDDPT